MSTFVIGDVHGHLDRLEALLRAESILGNCPACNGMGNLPCPDPGLPDYECSKCDGYGVARIDTDTLVIQLGDLGHYGKNGSPTGDLLCWNVVCRSRWCDIVLWGNHDRAIVQNAHSFNGYLPPDPAIVHYMNVMREAGRLVLAQASHGHLLTHAGLHKAFKNQPVDPALKYDVEKFVDWLNDADRQWFETREMDNHARAIRDCVGAKRGGRADHGGILWRDSGEKLYQRWPQVFGHTKGKLIRTYDNDSYCIDLGSQDNGRLAGMWLPEREFVQINTNKRHLDTGEVDVLRFPA